MVSGFFTSPCDHSRIFSGDASEMRIALNESGSFGFSKKLKMSFTGSPWFLETASTRCPTAEQKTRRRGVKGVQRVFSVQKSHLTPFVLPYSHPPLSSV